MRVGRCRWNPPQFVEKHVSQFFAWLGSAVATRPVAVICATLFATVLCCAGFMRVEVVVDGYELWTPTGHHTIDQDRIVTDLFGSSDRDEVLLFTSRGNSMNILTKDVFDEVFEIFQEVATTPSSQGLVLADVCKTSIGQCKLHGVLRHWDFNATLYASTVSTDADILDALARSTYPDGEPVGDYELVLGGIERNDTSGGNGEILSAKGLQLIFVLDSGKKLSDLLNWESTFLDIGEKHETGEHVVTWRLAFRSWDDELSRSISSELHLLILAYVLMIAFTCMVLSKSPRFTRIRLGSSAVLTVFLSTIAGFGLAAATGVPITPLNPISVFLLLSLGVDDAFIIVASFDHQIHGMPEALAHRPNSVPQRIAGALKESGLTITYTSLTDVIAFLLGSVSSFPAIKYFCYTAAICITVDFIFQVTTFVAFLTLLEARPYDEAVLSSRVLPVDAGSGSKPEPEQEPEAKPKPEANRDTSATDSGTAPGGSAMSAVGKSAHAFVRSLSTSLSNSFRSSGSSLETRRVLQETPSRLQLWLRDVYGPFLLQPVVRGAIWLALSGLLAMNLWALTELRQGFDPASVMLDGSYVIAYVDTSDELGLFSRGSYFSVALYFRRVDVVSSPAVQLEMQRISSDWTELKYNDNTMVSWLSEFLAYVPTGRTRVDHASGFLYYNSSSELFLEDLSTFLDEDVYERFQDDVVFDTTKDGLSQVSAAQSATRIRASRFHGFHADVRSAQSQVSAMVDGRDLIRDSAFDYYDQAFAFVESYRYFEAWLLIYRELLTNLLLCCVAILLVSSVVLVRPWAVALVSVILAIVDIDIVGSIHLWGLRVNSVTVLTCVLSVGLVVDMQAHLIAHYAHQKPTVPRHTRVYQTLYEVGHSVLWGAVTTMVGVLCLSPSQSQAWSVFFKMFTSIVGYGSLHGLVLLPTILPLLPDPTPKPEHKQATRTPAVAPEPSLPTTQELIAVATAKAPPSSSGAVEMTPAVVREEMLAAQL